jgi:hypothetical protein
MTFVPFDCVDNGILMMSERDLERQGRPSRGTPTPPGYGYLAHHLPRKVAHARISDSATEQVLMLENFSTKTTFVLFVYIDNRILKTTRGTRKRQGRPSRGTPMPLGYGYLTHHLPRKVTRARISDSATEQVLTHETRGKKTILRTNCYCRIRPRRRFHPRQNLAQPQTTTWAEGPPPQRTKPAPRLGPRRPRQASGPRPRQPPLRRVSSTPR